MIDFLCQRWGCPPSAVLAEDAGLVMGIVAAIKDTPDSGEPVPFDPEREMLRSLADASSVDG